MSGGSGCRYARFKTQALESLQIAFLDLKRQEVCSGRFSDGLEEELSLRFLWIPLNSYRDESALHRVCDC